MADIILLITYCVYCCCYRHDYSVYPEATQVSNPRAARHCANIPKEQEGRTISEQALLLRWRTWYRYVCWCVTTIHLQKVRIVRHIYLYTNIPVFCLGYYIRLLPLYPKLELGFLKIDSDLIKHVLFTSKKNTVHSTGISLPGTGTRSFNHWTPFHKIEHFFKNSLENIGIRITKC